MSYPTGSNLPLCFRRKRQGGLFCGLGKAVSRERKKLDEETQQMVTTNLAAGIRWKI